jgi:hypothetical protein
MIYDACVSAVKAALIYDCLYFSSLGPILGKGYKNTQMTCQLPIFKALLHKSRGGFIS